MSATLDLHQPVSGMVLIPPTGATPKRSGGAVLALLRAGRATFKEPLEEELSPKTRHLPQRHSTKD